MDNISESMLSLVILEICISIKPHGQIRKQNMNKVQSPFQWTYYECTPTIFCFSGRRHFWMSNSYKNIAPVQFRCHFWIGFWSICVFYGYLYNTYTETMEILHMYEYFIATVWRVSAPKCDVLKILYKSV